MSAATYLPTSPAESIPLDRSSMSTGIREGTLLRRYDRAHSPTWRAGLFLDAVLAFAIVTAPGLQLVVAAQAYLAGSTTADVRIIRDLSTGGHSRRREPVSPRRLSMADARAAAVQILLANEARREQLALRESRIDGDYVELLS